ncbi:MAG: hypothetical protein ACOVQJ_11180 [Bacteroidia bacterium]|jgi:hypothetical protein
MKSLSYLLLSLIVLLSACRKYPEGPNFTVLPRKERIEGKWVAERVKYNEIDSLAAYKDHIWEFTRNYSVILQVGDEKRLGIWSTATSDTEFVIEFDDSQTQKYEILKLTMKEFWLRDKKTQLDFHLKQK